MTSWGFSCCAHSAEPGSCCTADGAFEQRSRWSRYVSARHAMNGTGYFERFVFHPTFRISGVSREAASRASLPALELVRIVEGREAGQPPQRRRALYHRLRSVVRSLKSACALKAGVWAVYPSTRFLLCMQSGFLRFSIKKALAIAVAYTMSKRKLALLCRRF